MKYIFIFFLLSPVLAISQNSFSSFYADTGTVDVIFFDFIELENFIFISIAENVYQDTSNTVMNNHKILKYDKNGDFQKSINVPWYVNRFLSNNTLDKNLAVLNDSTFVYLNETPNRNGTEIYAIDIDLNVQHFGTYFTLEPSEQTYFIEHRGAYIDDESIYLYGLIRHQNWSPVSFRGQLLRIDIATSEIIWEKIIEPEFQLRDILNLQPHPDGSLICQVNRGC